MSEFLSSIREVSKNYKVFDEWEQAQADNRARQKHLSATVPVEADKAEFNKKKIETILRATEIMDKRSEDNAENTEMATGAISSVAILPLAMAPSLLMMHTPKFLKKANPLVIQGISLGLTFAAGIGLILWGTKKQKEASRIGRFQAKNNELKDVKNFAIYTNEQIEAAKTLAENMPNEDKKPTNILSAFKEMKEMSRDKKEYKKWLQEKIKNPEDVNRLLNIDFTPEQIAQGAQDKEILINVVKDINITAEEYSENLENVFDTMGVFSGLAAIPLGIGINKVLKALKVGEGGSRTMVSVLAPLLATLGIMVWGTIEQKNAAKVGRFKQRQEILNDPNALLVYSQEDQAKAADIKAPAQKKSFFGKLGENFRFLGTYFGDRKEHKKHVKNEQPQNEKLRKALLETELSKEQLAEAKHLQEKTFKTFDRVDEMSQRYSEDVEAGTEIAKQAGSLVWSFGSMAILAAIPLLIHKGKFPMHKIANFFGNLTLDKGSSLRKAINKGHDIVKSDKSLKSHLSKAVFNKNSRKVLLQNDKLKPVVDELGNTLGTAFFSEKGPLEALKGHFKKGPAAKWMRNLLGDIGKLWAKSKAGKAGLAEAASSEALKFNYKNYKTLINTGVAGAVPIVGTIVGVPYAFNAWLTNIQKKAGKIGVMKAVNELDNAKLYVNEDASAAPTTHAPAAFRQTQDAAQTAHTSENNSAATSMQDFLKDTRMLLGA